MRYTRKFFSKLERKSINSLSMNQLCDTAEYISGIKFNQKDFPILIIFSNKRFSKKAKRHYLIRYMRKFIYNDKISTYHIISDIVPEKAMNNKDCFFVYYKDKYDKKGHIKSFRVKAKKFYGLNKIISGGQTGADQGGLVAGNKLKIFTGGTVPKNYITENGSNFDLKEFGIFECENANYLIRTEKNILEADGTVIFGNSSSPGSKQTINICLSNYKPFLVIPNPKRIDLYKDKFIKWIVENKIEILNVAGNRESKNKGIARNTYEFLIQSLSRSSIQKRNAMEYKTEWLNDDKQEIEMYYIEMEERKRIIKQKRKAKKNKTGEVS